MIISKYDEARFWSKVTVGDRSECWEWRGARLASGYGEFSVNGKNHRAHRIAYQLSVGDISDGLHICHSCDNPGCVNPAHLWEGTPADNIADRDAKGRNRAPRGSERPNSILTEDAVRDIRLRYATGRVTQKQLASEHGVDTTTVTRIISGQNWKHIKSTLTPEQIEMATDSNRARGERSGRAKLTLADVVEIRRKFAAGASKSELGREYGVSANTIGNAINRGWKQLT